MAPRFLNLVDLHRKFYKLLWLAYGRYKLVRQSVEMTFHLPEKFPGDGPGSVLANYERFMLNQCLDNIAEGLLHARISSWIVNKMISYQFISLIWVSILNGKRDLRTNG